ncbi:MAG: PKD domain-containing protein [Bacteroidota bacterium]
MKTPNSYIPFVIIAVVAFSSASLYYLKEVTARQQYADYLQSHPFHENQTRNAAYKKIAKQDRPDLAWEQDFIRTQNPNLRRPTPEKLKIAREETQAYFSSLSRARTGTNEFPWIERGPNNVGGRTRALLWDPNDPNETKVWAGGVTGGLWYNTNIYDADQSWVHVDDFWDNLSITCIATDPNNSSIFYVGTGEVYTGSSRGAGIWKSTDGGTSWSQLGSTEDFYYVNDIVVRDEQGASVVYAAIDSRFYQGQFQNSAAAGLRRSTNGGNSWTQVLPNVPGEGINFAPSDLEISASNRIWVGTRQSPYGADDRGGGYILFSDDGLNWTISYTSNVTNGRGRVELACAPSDNDVIYGMIENDAQLFEVVKTVNNGTSWSQEIEPNDADPGIASNDFTRGQAWYDLILCVNPSNADEVFAGGIDLFRSSNGVDGWNQVSHWYGGFGYQNVHADQHQIVFKPGSSTDALFGNDGGVYLSTDMNTVGVPTISNRNKNYNVTQFYAGALHPQEDRDYLLAGTQDNGTQQFSKAGLGDTYEVTGGDGAFTFIDQQNPNIQITSYVYNSYYLSVDGGSSFSRFINEDDGSFINPADYDNNFGILYANYNSTQIARYSGLRANNPSQTLLTLNQGGNATALTASPYSTSSSTLFVGTSSGDLFRVDNADGTPSTTAIGSTSFPTGSISCIEFGGSEDELLVTFFNYGVTSIWYTADGGSNWVSKEGDLPDFPVRWALFNPNDRNEVLLATELGIWRSIDFDGGNPTWVSSNEGLANVRVDMLQIRDSDDEVAAFTYGRGAYTSSGFSEVNLQQANFSASSSQVVDGASINFSDLSTGSPVSWDWTFEGGSPSTSVQQNPTVLYGGNPGSYDVSLTVTYSDGSTSTKEIEGMVTVASTIPLPNIAPYKYSLWDDIITIYNTTANSSNELYRFDADITNLNNSVYLGIMVASLGDIPLEESIEIEIKLDGQVFSRYTKTYTPSNPFNAGFISWNFNFDVGPLSAGLHSVSIEIDPDNSIDEKDESDNTYTRNFYVNDFQDPAVIWNGFEWSNGTGPDLNSNDPENVVLAGDYIFDETYLVSSGFDLFPVRDLTIMPGVSMSIHEDDFLEVNGDFTNDGVLEVNEGGVFAINGIITNYGEMLVKSGGSFFSSNTTAFDGEPMKVQRNTRYGDGKYSFVGTPMLQDEDGLASVLGSFVYKYDETVPYSPGDGINNWIDASSDELEPGRGYTQANKKRIEFIGFPNQGDIVFSGTYTNQVDAAFQGYNLVANPYATSIEVSEFLTENTNIEGAVYIWDDNGSDISRGSSADYIVANGIGATNTIPTAGGGADRYNGHMGVGQGFFVKLQSAANTDINFTAVMRRAISNLDENFFRNIEQDNARIDLTNDQGLFEQTLIGWRDDASATELVRLYDASVFSEKAATQLYTLKAGKKLAIQGLPMNWKQVSLGLNVQEAGTYQIEMSEGTRMLLLHDKLENKTIDLRNESYSFYSNVAGEVVDRFLLLSNYSTVLSINEEKELIFVDDRTLYFQLQENALRSFKIVSLNGQVLREVKPASHNYNVPVNDLPTGVYLVSDGTKSHKILVR